MTQKWIRRRKIRIVVTIGLLVWNGYLLSFFCMFRKVDFFPWVEAGMVECGPVGISVLYPADIAAEKRRNVYIAYVPLIKFFEWRRLALSCTDIEEFLSLPQNSQDDLNDLNSAEKQQ